MDLRRGHGRSRSHALARRPIRGGPAHDRRTTGAAARVCERHVRLALHRYEQESQPPLVRHGRLRQQSESATPLPTAAQLNRRSAATSIFCRRERAWPDMRTRTARSSLRSFRVFPSILLAFVGLGCEFAGGSGGDVGSKCDMPPMCGGQVDPLYTCSDQWDKYDCQVLALAAAANEPDPMIFKAQISLESNFQVYAISPDSPCRTPAGWTDAESKSFGLMQLTPACGWLKQARLPDNHPNMEMDMTAPGWATSVFNPELNVNEGVRAVQVG